MADPRPSASHLAVVFAASLATLAAPHRPILAEDGLFTGVIGELTCNAEILEIGATKPVALVQARDIRRPVASGDRLRCTGPGQIVVRQGRTSRVLSSRDGWVTLQASPILTEIAQRFDLAATRGPDHPVVWSPPAGGAAKASDLVIRWGPTLAAGRVSLVVWTKREHRKICCDGTFDATKGTIEPADLGPALIALRDRVEAASELVLGLMLGRRTLVVDFSILSNVEEAALSRELAEWEGKQPLLRHLGRAHVFHSRKLLTQAAKEVEAALSLQPESCFLLEQAIEAEAATGNQARSYAVALKLQALAGPAQERQRPALDP